MKRLCTVVVVPRDAGHGAKDGGRGAPSRGLRWLTMARVDIASSDIRARVRAGRTIRYLVPPAVERLIIRHRLYGLPPSGTSADGAGAPD